MDGETNTQNQPPNVTIQDPEFSADPDVILDMQATHEATDLFPELEREDRYILGGIGAAALVSVVTYRGAKERFSKYSKEVKEFGKEVGRGLRYDVTRGARAILRGGFKIYDKVYEKAVQVSAKFHSGEVVGDAESAELEAIDDAYVGTLGAVALSTTPNGDHSRFGARGRSFKEVRDDALRARPGDDRYFKRILATKAPNIEALVQNAKARRASGRDTPEDLAKSIKDLHLYIDTIKPTGKVRGRLHRWGIKLGMYKDPATVLHGRVNEFHDDIARVQSIYLGDVDRAKQARAEGNPVLYNQIMEEIADKLQRNVVAGAIEEKIVPAVMKTIDDRLSSPLEPGNDTVATRSLQNSKKLETDETERSDKLRRGLTDPGNIIGLKQAIEFEIRRAANSTSLSQAEIDALRLYITEKYLKEYTSTEDGSDLPDDLQLQITRLLHLPLSKLTSMLKARSVKSPRRRAA